MDVKKLISIGSCFFCLSKTKGAWCHSCAQDFIRETPRCPVCANISPNEYFCGKCLHRPPAYNSTTVLFDYEFPAFELIKAFKFNRRPELSKTFAEQLSRMIIEKHKSLPETVVPVPLHKSRQRYRGYNQSLELAREICKLLEIKLKTGLCSRIKNTDPQSSLPTKIRRKNVKNAFILNEAYVPKHIAIIDDVITTGSTINEIATLLKKAGCENIDVWAIART